MHEIEQIELSLEEAKKFANARKSLQKLESNREFKKLFIEGYLKDEVLRLHALLADPVHDANRDNIYEDLQAISHFREYLRNIAIFGEQAENAIIEMEEELDHLRMEEDGVMS